MENGMGIYDPWKDSGLSKRELFAALMCAADTAGSEGYVLEASRAEWAVKQADALIEALNKEEGPADA